MSDTKNAFKEIRQKAYTKAKELFVAVAVDAHASIKAGYTKIQPVYDDNGKKLSMLPDEILAQRVSEAVTLTINDELTAARIYLAGAEENKEAMRWYAYGTEPVAVKNPFMAAYHRLQKSEELERISQSLDKK